MQFLMAGSALKDLMILMVYLAGGKKIQDKRLSNFIIDEYLRLI